MSITLRLFVLSALVLALFLAAVLLAQGWLHRQHQRLQQEAVETKRTQLAHAVAATAGQPDLWSDAHLAVLGNLIDATITRGNQTGDAPAHAGLVRFTHEPSAANAPALTVEFPLPHVARLSLVHGHTWSILLLSCLALMLIAVSLALLAGRRGGHDERAPWSSAKAEMGSLEQLAKTSLVQSAALTEARDTRRRMEHDLALHQQMQNRALEEKIRLGRDLHDGLIQSLYAVGLTLEATRPLIRRDPEKADQRLSECLQSLNHAIRQVRACISGLSPEKLQRENFEEAVRFFLNELRVGREVEAEVVIDEDAAAALNPGQTTEALQVIHEAVSNALRHGRASRLAIRLHRGDREIGLMIKDNGAGFTPDSPAGGGHGLANMRARATAAGATLLIDSMPGSGTRIVMTLPFSTPA